MPIAVAPDTLVITESGDNFSITDEVSPEPIEIRISGFNHQVFLTPQAVPRGLNVVSVVRQITKLVFDDARVDTILAYCNGPVWNKALADCGFEYYGGATYTLLRTHWSNGR